jgi:hypothetical protein
MDQPSPLGTNGKALNKLVHFRLTRKTFFVGLYFLLPALGVASVIQLAFVAEGGIKRGPPKDDSIGSSTWTEPKNISITLPDYPDHVFAGQSGLKLSSAASSLGSTALIAILAWFASRTGPVQVRHSPC